MCEDDNLSDYSIMKKIGFNAGGHHSFILPIQIKEKIWSINFLFDQNLYPIYFERSIVVQFMIIFENPQHFIIDLEITGLFGRKKNYNYTFLFDTFLKQYLKINKITDFIKDSIKEFYNIYY